MIVLQTNNSSRLIEVDKSIFDEAKEFLINISKKEKRHSLALMTLVIKLL